MKEEFLKNFKVGDQALPDDVVEAILAENGRDVEAAKAPYADYDSISEQLKTAKDMRMLCWMPARAVELAATPAVHLSGTPLQERTPTMRIWMP